MCYETIETKETDWHHCRTCSAIWCDSCMESMFNTARDSDDVDGGSLACPQCRTGVGEMQFLSRIGRYTDQLRCTEEAARDLVWFENLLVECVHLAECEQDGQPYFMIPPEEVGRVMSRDEICDIVDAKMGHAAGTRLRRMLRSGSYGECAALVIEGYAGSLRSDAKVTSAIPFLDLMIEDLRTMAADGQPHAERVATGLLPKISKVFEALKQAEQAEQQKNADSSATNNRGRGRGKRPSRSTGSSAGNSSGGKRKRS